MKVGLVLEGGAMRGMFTAGVTDVFMENGVSFDGLIGVSAGAAFGCNIKSGQIGRAIRYNKKYCADHRFVSYRSLVFTGNLYNVEFAYHTIPERLDPFDREAFAANPLPMTVVATDVTTGRAVYHLCTDGGPEDIEWIRASASMPVVSRVVRIGEYSLLDGGIADPVPFRYFLDNGYPRCVVILTQPAGYVKEPVGDLRLARLALRKYPRMIAAMEDRHIRYNRMLAELAEEEKKGTVLAIRPPHALDVDGVVREPERLEAAYQTGRSTGEEMLDAVRAFLCAARGE
jgi:predicted patatin/cPLA2 family phospholipase